MNCVCTSLRALSEEFAAEHSAVDGSATDFSIVVEGVPRDLHPILQHEIYWIAREALRNAFRHARARRSEVEIRYDAPQFHDTGVEGSGIDLGSANDRCRQTRQLVIKEPWPYVNHYSFHILD